MKNSYKHYYIERIMEVSTKHNLNDYTTSKLEAMSENDIIGIWDYLRWNYGDLSSKDNK
jgi:hypothetical protein